jgi:hypothetical protein
LFHVGNPAHSSRESKSRVERKRVRERERDCCSLRWAQSEVEEGAEGLLLAFPHPLSGSFHAALDFSLSFFQDRLAPPGAQNGILLDTSLIQAKQQPPPPPPPKEGEKDGFGCFCERKEDFDVFTQSREEGDSFHRGLMLMQAARKEEEKKMRVLKNLTSQLPGAEK